MVEREEERREGEITRRERISSAAREDMRAEKRDKGRRGEDLLHSAVNS